MATSIFVNIPVPAANGSGAAVDVSTLGYSKTLSVTGPFVGSVTLEISNEAVPTQWAPVATFNGPDGLVLNFAAHWMRATVTGYKSGTPQCDVGGTDGGALFAELTATAGNGAGAAVDTSTLGLLKTVTVGGPFRGGVQVEVSEDGSSNWSQIGFSFANPGQQTVEVLAKWMRVVREGVPGIDPGLPIVSVGACEVGGGGGGVSGIDVEDEGVPVGTGFTTLDFVGAGVTATDAGGGVAQISIPGGITGIELLEQPPRPSTYGPVPDARFSTMGVHPSGTPVYVSQLSGSKIWHFSTADYLWQPAAAPTSIALDAAQRRMLFSTDGSLMYVQQFSTIQIVDTATNAILGFVTGATSGDVYAVMSSNGSELWASGYNSSFNRRIFIADLTTDAFTGSIASAILGGCRSSAFDTAGAKFYEAGSSQSGIGTPQIAIYDVGTQTLITTIDDDSSKSYSNICALPDGTEMWFLYAPTPGNSAIGRLSTTTNAIVGVDIPTSSDGSNAGGFGYVVANPVLPEVYVSLNNGDIDVISTVTHAVIATIVAAPHIGNGAYSLAVSPDGTRLYQNNIWLEPYSINVIDTTTRTIVETVTVDSVEPIAPVDIGTFTELNFAGPVITNEGGGQALLSFPVIYDDGLTPNTNIKANRDANDRSLTDDTKKGITNLGSGSTASADYATVVGGRANTASGDYSTAAGYGSLASGEGAVALGGAYSAADYAIAEGYGYVEAGSNEAHAEGNGYVDADSEAAHAEGDGYVFGAYGAHAEGGGGAYAEYAHGEGGGSANAQYSHAEGDTTTADGVASHAEGANTSASGDSSHAEGDGTSAEGVSSHTEGTNTTAEGDSSHAEGLYSTAQGEASHAEGNNAQARGLYSHAEGLDTFTDYSGAGAIAAHAEGRQTHADGHHSHAEGFQTEALAAGAHAEGLQSSAQAQYSHAGGIGAKSRQAGEWAYASGLFNNNYVPQGAMLVLRANCDNNPVLKFDGDTGYGNTEFQLVNGETYLITVSCVVVSFDGFSTYCRTIKYTIAAQCVAGIARIAQIGATESMGDAYDAAFTLVPSVSGTNRKITFTATGYIPGSNTTVAARLDWVQTPRY